MTLDDLVGGIGKPDGDGKNPLPEAQVATLLEVAARYAAPVPFKVGDLVTPRKGYNIRDAGDPHIVLEVPKFPIRNFAMGDDPSAFGSAFFGARLDIRVGTFDRGHVAAYWGESFRYEPYTGPMPETH